MKKNNKIIAIAVLLLMVVSAVVPITMFAENTSAADTTTDNSTLNAPDLALVSEYEKALTDAGFQLIEKDGQYYVTLDGTEYSDPIALGAFLVGLAIGAFIGGAVTYIVIKHSSPDTTGITQENLNQAFRQGEATKVAAVFDAIKNLSSSVLPADATLWSFTTNYWQRAVEYNVAEFWQEGGTLDVDQAMNGIGLYTNIANYLFDWSEAMDEGYNNILSYPNQGGTDWTQSGLNTMDMQIVWDNGHISGGTPITSAYDLWTDFAQYISTSPGHDVAYIDTEPPKIGSISTQYYDNIYNFGSGQTTITNLDTGLIYRLDAGSNYIANIYCVSTSASGKLPSGDYQFQDGRQIAGPLVPMGSDSAANVQGVLVFGNATTTNYALSNGSPKIAIYGGTGSKINDSTTLKFSVAYNGPDGDTTADSLIFGVDSRNSNLMYDLVGSYTDLISQIQNVIYAVKQDALATWQIFDLLQQSSTAISPSIIRSTAGDIQMSAAEYVAVTVQMMIQAHDAVAANWDNIQAGSININPESLGLYCYGNIYQNGTLWAENVVFTPYINNTDQHLAIGSNTWDGTGYAMIWWQGDNILSWTGSASLSSYTYVALDKNTTIDIKQIYKNNQTVTSVDLTRNQIIKYNTGSDVPYQPPGIPQVNDSLIKTLVIVICALICALIFFAISYIDEDYELYAAIIAVVLFAILYFLSGTITDIMTGNFHFHLSLWPFLIRGGL